MHSLFPIYRGRFLEVTPETDAYLRESFPEVDLPSIFREADAWLWANPRKRPKRDLKRFLVNWILRSKYRELRTSALEQERRRDLRVAINAGGMK